MKARILITLLLASGLAVAQTQQPGSSPGSSDQNQPTQTQPSTQDQQPPASPSTQDQQQPASPSTQDQQQSTPPTQPSDQSNPSAATSPGNSQEAVARGCLKQSGGNWVVSQNGQDTPVTGDDSMLKPHDGHEVEVHGTATSGGGLQVTSVTMVSESCTGGGNDQSAAPSSAGAEAGAAAAGAAAAASGQATTQTSDQSPPANAGAAGSSATKTLTPEEQAQQSKNIANLPHGGSSLPQTGSPLPLIGLLGLGSLVTGLIVRKK